MRSIICFTLITCCLFSCRRKDTYPDYRDIIGKYKLVYIDKWNTSWPPDSVVRLFPSDQYEVEFKKMSKVKLSKNGNCEKKLKIYSCRKTVFISPPQSYSFVMKIDEKTYGFEFPFYASVNDFTDTLRGESFYPFDLASADNGYHYWCTYFKE